MTTPQPELGRLDALLMRVLDDEASGAERQELLALADADVRLAEAQDLRSALRAAVLHQSGDTLDVVPQVLMALGLDDGWDAVSESLQAALVDESLQIDVSDAVMAALDADEERSIELSALHDGELTAERRMVLATALGADRALIDQLNRHADLGRHLREAIAAEARHADLSGVWAGVAPAIGLEDPEGVAGWELSAPVLREAVAEAAALPEAVAASMADDIMAALPALRSDEPVALEFEESEPEELEAARGWFGMPFGTLLAVVAALLLVVPLVWEGDPESTTPSEQHDVAEVAEVIEVAPDEAFELLPMDAAEPAVVIESLEVGDDVLVQVMQGEEEGDATVLWIAEPIDDEEGATL